MSGNFSQLSSSPLLPALLFSSSPSYPLLLFSLPFFQISVSFFYTKIQIIGENMTKIKTILTHWSLAQAGSSNEKNGVKNLVGLSL